VLSALHASDYLTGYLPFFFSLSCSIIEDGTEKRRRRKSLVVAGSTGGKTHVVTLSLERSWLAKKYKSQP
jgi:hypothetical protein